MRNGKIKCAAAVVILFLAISIQPQTGGDFEITQSVIASGGGQGAAGGDFSLDGTTGQSIAGGFLIGEPFAVSSGFWSGGQLAPTSARVFVGGRVLTADGRGIRNAAVTLTKPSGEVYTVLSTQFGYYRFNDIAVGETYIFTAAAKEFTFKQPTQVRFISESVEDINFIAHF